MILFKHITDKSSTRYSGIRIFVVCTLLNAKNFALQFTISTGSESSKKVVSEDDVDISSISPVKKEMQKGKLLHPRDQKDHSYLQNMT